MMKPAREPDFIVGGEQYPYLLRWFLIPRNRWFNVYLHCFLRSDDDRAHHDHPWLFNFSWLRLGEYDEHTIDRGGIHRRTRRRAGDWKLRIGPAPHRIELIQGQPCWTIFITGPRIRSWGFHCPERGWVHWKRFTAADDPGKVGKGCDA
jgi:hypothetical protein